MAHSNPAKYDEVNDMVEEIRSRNGKRNRSKEWKETITDTPSEMSWARLAAYIDGEGCIHICGSRRAPCGSLTISVYNTDPRLIMWCRHEFGGCVGSKDHRGKNRKVLFRWSVASQRAEWVLRGCFNWFLLKREQAEIGLAFRETFRERPQRDIPPDVKGKRLGLKAALAAAKQQHTVVSEAVQ